MVIVDLETMDMETLSAFQSQHKQFETTAAASSAGGMTEDARRKLVEVL